MAPRDRITTTIEREWLKEIIARRKRVEVRALKPYWTLKLSRVRVPFELRLINGMQRRAPEATVLVSKVTKSRRDHEYRLHIARVLEVKHWDRRRERPAPASARTQALSAADSPRSPLSPISVSESIDKAKAMRSPAGGEIQIVALEGVPRESVASLARALVSVGHVRIREERHGTYGAAEWALPALVGVLVVKPLVDGFLKELGAGGARTLRAKVATLIRRLRARAYRYADTSELEAYIKQVDAGRSAPLPGRLGPVFSIACEIERTTRITYSVEYVFPYEISDDGIAAALKQLPHDVRAAGARERANLAAIDGFSGSATYVYSSETAKWQRV